MEIKTSVHWLDSDITYLKENYTNGHIHCANLLNRSVASIKGKCNRLGLKLPKHTVMRNMSHNILNIADYIDVTDPKIAYILGLIWTDGCVVYSNNNSKTPVVKHTAVYYDNFSNIFQDLNWRTFKSENNKSIGKNTMVTSWISSRELGDYLILNNYRNKVLGTEIFKTSHKLLAHFVRGLFDGDGCFSMSNIGTKYKQFHITFSSCYEQNWNFLTNILDNINVKYKHRLCVDNLGKSSQLNIIDSISIYNLCEFMYEDSESIRLERKYKIYLTFIDYKKIFKRNNKLKDILL